MEMLETAQLEKVKGFMLTLKDNTELLQPILKEKSIIGVKDLQKIIKLLWLKRKAS